MTIVALAAATAATRASFWVVGHHINIPKRVHEVLRYAPACALAAIVAPDLLLDTAGHVQFEYSNPKLVSALVSVVFYLLRRNMLETIIFGMAFFTALRLLHVF
nr:AzlD domain-containing protein [Pseudoduganella ginsengisoli]